MNMNNVKPKCESCKKENDILVNGLCYSCGRKMYDRYLEYEMRRRTTWND